jgi:cytochrome c
MKKVLLVVIAVVFGFINTQAQEKHGTPAQAIAMVKKAIDFIKANGKEKAFAAFDDPKGKFVDGDVYVMIYDFTGKCLAHGTNPKMIGKDMSDMTDGNGKLYIKERLEIAKTKGTGWQDYKWGNPVSKKIENKSVFIQKFDDLIICSGIYKK